MPLSVSIKIFFCRALFHRSLCAVTSTFLCHSLWFQPRVLKYKITLAAFPQSNECFIISAHSLFSPFLFYFCVLFFSFTFFSLVNTVVGSCLPPPKEPPEKYRTELVFNVGLQLTDILFIWNMYCWVVYGHQSHSPAIHIFQGSE